MVSECLLCESNVWYKVCAISNQVTVNLRILVGAGKQSPWWPCLYAAKCSGNWNTSPDVIAPVTHNVLRDGEVSKYMPEHELDISKAVGKLGSDIRCRDL